MAETSALGVLQFQQKIRGAVRPNLFSVFHKFPSVGGLNVGEKDLPTYLCKSAALPASTVGTVELPFRGRVIKVPGDRTFESWTATFYMDDAFELRGAYEKWIELTNSVDTNTAAANMADVLQDITVTQLDKFGGTNAGFSTIREYKLISAFPVSVSQVSLAYDNNDSYEEFDVEFAYQFFETDSPNNKNLMKRITNATKAQPGTGSPE
mgnify:FL=1|jgi:hypothetical protein|tara:strand:- start:51 stop:677 length:627 start_codon:yes stop_codon:yes gene_type:complete